MIDFSAKNVFVLISNSLKFENLKIRFESLLVHKICQ